MQREARARSRSPIARAKIHRHSGALPQPHQGDSSPPEPRKARMDTSALVPTRTSVQSFFTSTLDAIHTCPRRETYEEGGADRGGEDIRKSRVRDCRCVCAGGPVPSAERRGAGSGRARLRDARLAACEGGGKSGVKGGGVMTANKKGRSVGPVPERLVDVLNKG